MDGNVGTLMGDTGGGGGGGGGGGQVGPATDNDYSEYTDSAAHLDEQQQQQQQHLDQFDQQQAGQEASQDAHDHMDETNHDDQNVDNLNSSLNISGNSGDMQNMAQKRQASDFDTYSNSSASKYQKRQKTGYNNQYSGGGGGGPFQNRAGKVDLRILLPSKDAGAIIGRGGSNIKKLRLEHKTIIQVPDCDGPERLLLIGGETDAAINTILDIIPLLEDNQFNNGPNDGSTELRLLVHQSQAGCVIGRNGDKIKDLRVKHNLDMKVYSECAPQSTERICQMKGKPHDIVQCLKEVLSLLDTAPPKGMIRPYDPHNHNEFLSSQYGGYISDKRQPGGPGGRMGGPGGGGMNAGAGGGFNSDRGTNPAGGNRGFNNNSYDGGMGDNRGRPNMRGGGHSRGTDRESRADDNGSNPGYRSTSNPSSRGGGASGFGRGGGGDRGLDNRRGGGPRNSGGDRGGRGGFGGPDSKPFNNNPSPYGRQTPNNGSNNGSNGSPYGANNAAGGAGSMPAYSNQASNNSSNNAGISTNQVTIPNELAGAIIGPKGQKIQQIREQSGAGITIDKPMPGSNDRIITIQGTPEQIQNAQYLLQLTVKQSGLWQGQ